MIDPTGIRSALAPLALAASAALLPLPVAAHTGFMLPNVFVANTERMVTLESAFSEDFFQPEIALESEDFHVIGPDGERSAFDRVSPHKQVTILEAGMEADGTYRFTSGVRRGRTGKMAMAKDKWVPVRGDELPEGTEYVKTSQTETVSEVYVSKKGPTRAPVDVHVGRLEIHPITHPSDVYADGRFVFEVLFDGKPLAGQVLSLDRGNARYEQVKPHRAVTTRADGRVDLSFDSPGVYILMTRHRADAPAGAETDIRSYTTSLTFEVQS
ncbi:DUF4198 domain-containing protein [Novosphingobium sp. BW1]|uniref:DUF4198 domain-containing protein n=1 Tax=Novosphingobium sp. BW1 TaxID=2592621 RepID=UPI0011DEE583|nr:DUF4198 domain-containing protein [Novosphingobium sp. BW1]TYC86891.1 DUF4198 domain-containing protein [Novosphingobium sp. BW1]